MRIVPEGGRNARDCRIKHDKNDYAVKAFAAFAILTTWSEIVKCDDKHRRVPLILCPPCPVSSKWDKNPSPCRHNFFVLFIEPKLARQSLPRRHQLIDIAPSHSHVWLLSIPKGKKETKNCITLRAFDWDSSRINHFVSSFEGERENNGRVRGDKLDYRLGDRERRPRESIMKDIGVGDKIKTIAR